MIEFFKNLFGGPTVSYSDLMQKGAVIVDVRTKGEYNGGHINGSLNIPLDSLRTNLSLLDKNKTVITCCASGLRSGSARAVLKSYGFTEVYNGGGWMNLKNKISK